MDLKSLPPAMAGQLAAMVADYIQSSRKKYLPEAQLAPPALVQRLRSHFPASLLDGVRTVVLRCKRISDPAFYGMARMMGFRNLPSFADTAAVTFVDVIVSHQEFDESLLFHEMVHAVQYAQLGVKEFARRYVSGFLNGGSYENIPLEKHAHELESRFRANKGQPFAVENEVKTWLEADPLKSS
jgi:hypothetical protein